MIDQINKLNPGTAKKLKLGWIITGPLGVAGARIHGWNIHNYFLKNNIDTHISWSSKKYQNNLKLSKEEINNIFEKDINILILEGVKKISLEEYFFSQCKKYQIKTILIATDNINIEIGCKCDAVITVNEYTKSLFPVNKQNKVFVTIDHYEHNGTKIKQQNKKKELKMCFLSNNVFDSFPGLANLPDKTTLKIIGPPKKRVKKFTPHKKMFTETPYPFEYVVWSLDKVEKEILSCDIGLIPYPEKNISAEYIKRKSNNRLILFMSYGLPCIVSPVYPYLDVIKHGKNGFFAKTKDEWEKYVCLLRDNPKIREKIAETARTEVIEKYSIHNQAKQYLDVIIKLIEK